jgi:lipoate-protein ligase A
MDRILGFFIRAHSRQFAGGSIAMNLDVLPVRTAGAAENMAVDFLLLQRYPQAGVPRFRHYEWRGPAFTFGYAQKIELVRAQISAVGGDGHFDVCRRPTGGGIVDHREDWTYALVIPRGHPLEEARATQSYRVIHEALAEALREQGVDAITKQAVDEAEDAGAGVCFQRAEVYDVVHAATGNKIAGAAQKRNKHGLLFQGSIWRPAVKGGAIDWERFGEDFSARLAAALGGAAEGVPWPELDEEEVSGLTEQYASAEWMEFR